MNYIYVYTNKINHHQYVGQTNDIDRRKREHHSESTNPNSSSYNNLFHQKLREYGEENFEFCILEEVNNTEQANAAEKKWIKQLKTYAGWGFGGYNMDLGGQNYIGYLYKEEIDNIKTDIKQGLSYKEISQKYGISPAQISNINTGKQYFDSSEHYPLYQYIIEEDKIEEVRNLLMFSELTMKAIAEQTQFAYSTIKKINSGILRKKEGLSYPLRKDIREIKANKVKELLAQGKSNAEIIALTGVSASTVIRINNGVSYTDNNLQYPLR